MERPAPITFYRITELVMLARTNGYAYHAFAAPAKGSVSLVWSNVAAQATLTVTSAAGQVEQVVFCTDLTAPMRIWRAISERLALFLEEQAQALGE